MSPSLRGSGLKYRLLVPPLTLRPVSLFTREWIEIPCNSARVRASQVSLFTREWIEIIVVIRDEK